MDPFEILGLPADATAQDAKHAFRRLAMSWHPDRNRAPHAEERFKQIKAAYELLCDPQWLAARASEPGETDAAVEFEIECELSLEEAAVGGPRSVALTDSADCSACAGSGRKTHAHTVACTRCKGCGRLRDARKLNVPCPDCSGRGYVAFTPCAQCAGSGVARRTREFEVALPPAMLSGECATLRARGPDGRTHTVAVTVRLRPHPLFRLEGRNLHCEVPVSLFGLLAGANIEVPVLGGTCSAAPGSGEAIMLPGRGYPGRADSAAGDLHARIRAVMPVALDARQKKLLAELQALVERDLARHAPELAAWRERLRGVAS